MRSLHPALRPLADHLGSAALTAWGIVLLLWLLDAAGRGLPPFADRLAVLLAASALVLYVARTARRLWRREGDGEPLASRLLLALVILSFVFHFTGLEHEVASRYFGDEGTYRSYALKTNDGQILHSWFVYPHLLFYLDAVVLWVTALFEPVTHPLARFVYGVEGPGVGWLATRCVAALCGALTVLPVFGIARRLLGRGPHAVAGAGLAGAFAALSPIYLEVAHLNISDVPSAFFATLTLMQVGRLLDRESLRDYLLAGLWAGLATGSKYPAGVVAVAIVAVWIRWRLRTRRFGWGLAAAGAVALAAFVATTPGLVAYADKAYTGHSTDVLFGYRQYARAGWTGVIKDSNVGYYLRELRRSFGEPLLVLGLIGLAAWRRDLWSRLAWMAVFPAVFLALLLSMNMAVRRNLLPVLPILAVFLGVGAAGWWLWLARWRPAVRRPVLVALAALLLAVPAIRSSALVIRFARPTTRDLAADWMRENLPPGSFLVQEAYTPRVGPEWYFRSRRPRFVARLGRDELRQPQYDFVFLASAAYSRFVSPQNRKAGQEVIARNAARYQEIFDTFKLVMELDPGPLRAGPVLQLYEVDPDPLSYATHRTFEAGEALLRDDTMLRDDGAVHYGAAEHWSLFKAYLEPGRYRAAVRAEPAEGIGGELRVLTRGNRDVGRSELVEGVATVELPAPDKYFFYVHLPAGSRLHGFEVSHVDAVAGS